jgi:hypothetical protein
LVGLAKLATHPDLRRDDALEFAQLALRRCTYLLLEMYAIERRAPEACALVARSVVETALIGSYLAVTPDASSRLVKKQAKHSRRLRDRLLAGDNDAVLALAERGLEHRVEPGPPALLLGYGRLPEPAIEPAVRLLADSLRA